MGALGHFIERAGVATAQISLIREQTAAIKPPRALWVPFMLGRPFGAPNAPDFQRKVLRALLGLFARPAGPVLEDFAEDAPFAAADETTFACPVSFARADAGGDDHVAAMQREIAQLAPWYELARKRRGRTTVGVSGLTMEAAAAYAGSYAQGAPVPVYDASLSAGVALKRACDDLKTYHYEAVAAQPGNLSAPEIDHWFWFATATGKAFLAIQQTCLRSDDKSLMPLARLSLVPRAIAHAVEEQARSTA